MSGEMMSDNRCWYAIHTKPKEEDRVYSNLIAWGVESFSPRIKEPRYNQFTGKPVNIVKPLFPRYIFARFDAGKMLHKIYYTRGVHSVIGFGSEPTPIDDETIAVIQSRVGKDGFVVIGEDLKRGDEVMIQNGSLKGLSGIFEGPVHDSQRVMILLTTIKYQASIMVDRAVVQKAYAAAA
jgi:transcriptional antiterminator RfaH